MFMVLESNEVLQLKLRTGNCPFSTVASECSKTGLKFTITMGTIFEMEEKKKKEFNQWDSAAMV